MDENKPADVVEELIQTCRDGEKGYQAAAEHAKRSDLKTYFNEQSQSELARLGKPDNQVSGSATGAMHRAWIDTKANLGGGDKTILESVEAGEDNARDKYQKALNANLPTNVADIVRRQAASVQRAHDRVRSLRDEAKAA